MTTRLSFLLLIVALLITTLTPQGSARKIPANLFNDPRDFFKGSPAKDKSLLWKVHLALQLVKHPELNERQERIILNAISLSTPDFFAFSNESHAKGADEDLQSLKRRALDAFPNSQAADLFSNIAEGRVEEGFLKMYFYLAALPLKQRKILFRNASSTHKSALWRTHLAVFLAKRPELNERQKDIILAAMSLATPEHFGIRTSDYDWKRKVHPLRSLEEQIVTTFSLEDAAKIFATLGYDSDRSASYDASVMLKSINYKSLSEYGPYKRTTHNQTQPVLNQCGCSTASDWCPLSSYCKEGGCSRTDTGCGTFWKYSCNGDCA